MSVINPHQTKRTLKSTALRLVILIGLVSLLADLTYEGARSITGQFLAQLGASASIVGFVAGFGEFLGYALRLISGYLVDKTERYWTIIITGYVLNVLAVPFLALVHSWQLAAVFIILERVGKAIRVPARDAMLAHTGKQLGSGWAFGIHEALDKTGAMLGPLLIALILYLKGDYRDGFAILLAPAIITISVLLIARFLYPKPQNLESNINIHAKGMDKTFWLYLIAASFVAAGYADFSLMAFHLVKNSILTSPVIPMVYALAMGVSAATAFVFGKMFDNRGFSILIAVTILSSLFAPLVFWGGASLVFVGVTLWSIGLSAHESF